MRRSPKGVPPGDRREKYEDPKTGKAHELARRDIGNHDYTADEIEFLAAMETYKKEHCRKFPTWTEALHVLKSLGYKKRKKKGA